MWKMCHLGLYEGGGGPLEPGGGVEAQVQLGLLLLLPVGELEPPELNQLLVLYNIHQPMKAFSLWSGGPSTYWLLDSGVWAPQRGSRWRRSSMGLGGYTAVSPLPVS